MAIRITSNPTALSTLRHIDDASQALNKSSARLASGSRIQNAGDDPSGSARAAFLEVSLRDQKQIYKNAEDGKSVLQVAENGLNEVNNMMMRMRELAVAAASDIAGPEERDAISIEITEIKQEIDRIAGTTHYGKHYLLNGSFNDFGFHVGTGSDEYNHIYFSGGSLDMQTSTLGVDSVDVSDSDSAFSSIEAIDEGLMKVQMARARTGALQSRLQSVSSLSQQSAEVTAGQISRIKDTDYATESSEFTKRQIQLHSGVAMLAQANQSAQNVLHLLAPIK